MAVSYLVTLYKKTSTGAIQQWKIGTEDTTIVTVYGQVGGKLQTTKEQIPLGKNQGRKNETAPAEQALKEAVARWTKKKKAGYVENSDDAESGEVDAIIEGGISPMLAKVFEDHSEKLEGRIAVQPKLDGGRMICVINDKGVVSLWTRTRKRITSMVHIEDRMEHVAAKKNLRNIVFDGEVYSHEYKNDFEKLMSAFRKSYPTPEAEKLEYHIYDVVSNRGFEERAEKLWEIERLGGKLVRVVETYYVDVPSSRIPSEVTRFHDKWVSEGYEGAMVRQLGREYEFKRSDQLLKVKKFQDEEFEIVGVEEGRGKLAGHAGNFVCVTKGNNGSKFGVKMAGETSRLKEIFENQDDYIGKMLTVQFQGKTKDGIPRFPVGLRLRGDDL